MRETWESLIRDFVRHLKGTNRAVNTETIYRRAALGLVAFLEQDGHPRVSPGSAARRPRPRGKPTDRNPRSGLLPCRDSQPGRS